MTSQERFIGVIVDNALKNSWLLDPEVDAHIQRMREEREEEERQEFVRKIMRQQDLAKKI